MVMFNKLSQLLFLAILGLCVWLWYQSHIISSLRADNLAQVQTIAQQQQANQRLIATLEQERQAVEKSQKIANELQNKVEMVQSEIKSILAKDNCAKANLPNGVADGIKRLHQQNNNKY